jgi:hypothetical protein
LDVIALSDGLCERRADWLDRFKPHIENDKTIVVSRQGMRGAHVDDTVVMHLKARTLAEELGIMILSRILSRQTCGRSLGTKMHIFTLGMHRAVAQAIGYHCVIALYTCRNREPQKFNNSADRN